MMSQIPHKMVVICILCMCLFLGQCTEESDDDPDFRTLSSDFVPFRSYAIDPDRGIITLFNENGTEAYAVAFPYGPHAAPFTGHAYGKSADDWAGYLVLSASEMTDLGDGFYGIHKSDVEAKMPIYSSPVDGFVVTGVWKRNLGSDHIYYGDEMYAIETRIYNGIFHFEHLRALHDSFIEKMIQAGNVDPRTWTGPPGENLITQSFTLAKGDYLATPQIQAEEVPGHPDYIYYNIIRPVPWMQIEFTIFEESASTDGLSLYYLVPESNRNQFRQTIIKGADNPNLNGPGYNYIYDDYRSVEWYWRSELGLGKSSLDFDDHSSIISRLGDWWECKGDCPQRLDVDPGYTAGDPLTDDIFVVFPINKDTDVYKPELYSSGSISYIAQKHKYRDGIWAWYIGEVLEPGHLDPKQGQVKIKWKLLDIWNQIEEYQGMSYFLDSDAKKLKLHWQEGHVSSEAEIQLPPIPSASDAADGEVIIQYNGYGRWFSNIYGIN